VTQPLCLVDERNDTNHAPVVPDYSVTVGYPCVTLDGKASDPDQHALIVEWFDSSGASIGFGLDDFTGLAVCVDHAGTFTFRRTATDGRGGSATGTVTFTDQVTLQEIVLYAAAANVQMTGNWSRIADPTAAGVNKNGVLLRFQPGPQVIVIQTREDGVSVDQIVLSAEKYLTTRPGAAKNDPTILPATAPR
jgi:hypothetical protein